MSFEFGAVTARITLGGALLLGGCEVGEPMPDPGKTIVQESPAPKLPDVDVPGGVCVKLTPPFFTPDQMKEQAGTCKQAMGEGTVALVLFQGLDKTPQEITKAADQVESLVSETSEKLLNVKVDVVQASAEAENLQTQITGGRGCIDLYKQQPPSVVADRTMAELRDKYNFVIAVGPWADCSSSTKGGVAQLDGRHADVWGETLKADRDGKKASAIGFTAAHELLHLYGLDHEGELWAHEQSVLPFGGVADVRAMIENEKYYEYGRSGFVMSGNYTTDYILSDPIQLEALRWPFQILDGQPSAAIAVKTAESINHKGYNGQFFTITLSEPMQLKGSDKKVTSVAFVPNPVGVYGRDGFGAVDLCFITDHNDVVQARKYYDNPQAKTMVFDLGDQKLELTLTPKRVAARILS